MFCKERNWQTNYNSQWNLGFQKPNLITQNFHSTFHFSRLSLNFFKKTYSINTKWQNGTPWAFLPSFEIEYEIRLSFLKVKLPWQKTSFERRRLFPKGCEVNRNGCIFHLFLDLSFRNYKIIIESEE